MFFLSAILLCIADNSYRGRTSVTRRKPPWCRKWHMNSPAIFVGFTLLNLQFGMVCRSLFVLLFFVFLPQFCLILVIPFTTSGYPFGIFKLCTISFVLTDEGLVSTKSHSNDDNNTQKQSNKETQVTIFIKRKYIYP